MTYIDERNENNMLIAQLATWKQLLCRNKVYNNKYWENSLWTFGTGVSIRLILEAYKNIYNKEQVNIWIPEFFCIETETEFSGNDINIVRYTVLKNLEPDWKKIKLISEEKTVDIFLFVHYFGEYHDINKARVFCEQKKAILIEDCAHVLYKYDKIGKYGDFVLYSPHKFLPIPDGAIIQYNYIRNEKVKYMVDYIENRLEIKKHNRQVLVWKAKEIVQKITHINRPIHYECKEHYCEKELKRGKFENISSYSFNIINTYSHEELKKIGYIRRENERLMTYLLKQIEPLIVPIISEKNECPFFAVYSLEKISKKQEFVKKIQAYGIKVLFWPTLSIEIAKEDFNNSARRFSENLIMIPIHQGIKPRTIAKRIPNISYNISNDLSISLLENNIENEDIWNTILSDSALPHMTQDWEYGKIKTEAQNWDILRILIKKREKAIGVVQILEKKIFGLKVAVRINKGPVFIKEENNIDNELESIELIRRRYLKFIPIFYAPYSVMNEENYVKFIQRGWINWNIFGFPSGTIDLNRSVEEIRKALSSKWRNQLKSAEKKNYTVESNYNRFDEMIELYGEEQFEKGFKGVDIELLKKMKNDHKMPLRIYYIENEEKEIIAFDIFYRHVNAATYYIGWNSQEGRKSYLNNFLLYYAALELKREGVETLDLGGIEYIYTESIARFKDGMNPKHYRQMGEFFKI